MDWAPDGHRLAFRGRDNRVFFRDGDGKPIEGELGRMHVNCIAWSPNNKWIVTGEVDRKARLWDASSCRLIQEIHTKEIVDEMAWSGCGQQLLTKGTWQTSIKILEMAEGRFSSSWTRYFKNIITSIACSPQPGIFASGSIYGIVQLLHVNCENPVQCLQGHRPVGILSLAWSHDGARIASSCWDTTVRVWDCHSGNCNAVLECYSRSLHSVAWSPDGTQLAVYVIHHNKECVYEFDLAESTAHAQHKVGVCGERTWSRKVAWKPNGHTLALNTGNNLTLLKDRVWSDTSHYLYGRKFKGQVFYLMCVKARLECKEIDSLDLLPMAVWLQIFLFASPYLIGHEVVIS